MKKTSHFKGKNQRGKERPSRFYSNAGGKKTLENILEEKKQSKLPKLSNKKNVSTHPKLEIALKRFQITQPLGKEGWLKLYFLATAIKQTGHVID